MRWPCRTGHEISVGCGVRNCERDEDTACELDIWSAGRVGVDTLSSDDLCGRKNLWPMAQRSNGFVCLGEVADDLEDFGVEAEILGSAAARDDEAVVLLGLNLCEGGVEDEVVAGLFGVGLVTFKVVDGGSYMLACLFVRTDGVYRVANHLQRLKGHHHLVVFDVVAYEHEQFCSLHDGLLLRWYVSSRWR